MTVPMKQPVTGDIMESVLLKGDIAKLTPNERVSYYSEVCRSMGLNPLTKPFEFITLNGKLQLYALRSCTDQLRKLNGVSLEVVSREIANDILTVHVRASLPDGRRDEDLGAVAFPESLRGEARANAELKAVTKAKRRATLSICGLGWLDETEVEDIPASAKRPARPAPNVMLPEPAGDAADQPASVQEDKQTEAGEAVEWQEYVARWDAMLEEAPSGATALAAWRAQLLETWNSAVHKEQRRAIEWPEGEFTKLMGRVTEKLKTR